MDIQKLLFNQIQSNPNYQRVMDMIGNRNPQEVFYEECKKRNIDPSQILKLIK